MEQPVVRGITHDESEAKLTVFGVPDTPGVAASVFEPLADAGINVDMIVQNVSHDGTTDISFTVPMSMVDVAVREVAAAVEAVGAGGVSVDSEIAKVTVVGIGMKTESGIASQIFRILADHDINIQMISTSPIRISCVVEGERVADAVVALHTGLGLDGDDSS